MAQTEQRADATPFLPARRSLTALREAAAGCRGCPLHEPATQTVFGEGRRRARLMLVGEMPGDREDRAGRPFVGPAGRELDEALELAGIDRADVYITNVVKHFKFEQHGRRRIHSTPKKSEIDACFPWLREELAVVAPELLVILGATAGKALLAPSSACATCAACASTPIWRPTSAPRSTRRRSCAPATTTPATPSARRFEPTSRGSPSTAPRAHEPPSSRALRRARSLASARPMALAIRRVASFVERAGSPLFRSVMRVPPPSASCQA
ncbi:MAG: uracil-DNA glycosylase [Solirubrobacteraceae bacterium]|nr:uracil-DNA glycosylase [Solirubrobacteraceae bacterium]